jgi:hypothetical protein
VTPRARRAHTSGRGGAIRTLDLLNPMGRDDRPLEAAGLLMAALGTLLEAIWG